MQERALITKLIENPEKIVAAVLDDPAEIILTKDDISHLKNSEEGIDRLNRHFKLLCQETASPDENRQLYLLALAGNLALYHSITGKGQAYIEGKETKADKFYEKFDDYYNKCYETADTLKKLQLDYFVGTVYLGCGMSAGAIEYYEKVIDLVDDLLPDSVTYEQSREYMLQLAAVHLFRANDAHRKESYGVAEVHFKEIAWLMKKALSYPTEYEQDILHSYQVISYMGTAREYICLAEYALEMRQFPDCDEITDWYIIAFDLCVRGLKNCVAQEDEIEKFMLCISSSLQGIKSIQKNKHATGITWEQKESVRNCILSLKEYLQLHPSIPDTKELKTITRLIKNDIFSTRQPVHELWRLPNNKNNTEADNKPDCSLPENQKLFSIT